MVKAARSAIDRLSAAEHAFMIPLQRVTRPLDGFFNVLGAAVNGLRAPGSTGDQSECEIGIHVLYQYTVDVDIDAHVSCYGLINTPGKALHWKGASQTLRQLRCAVVPLDAELKSRYFLLPCIKAKILPPHGDSRQFTTMSAFEETYHSLWRLFPPCRRPGRLKRVRDAADSPRASTPEPFAPPGEASEEMAHILGVPMGAPSRRLSDVQQALLGCDNAPMSDLVTAMIASLEDGASKSLAEGVHNATNLLRGHAHRFDDPCAIQDKGRGPAAGGVKRPAPQRSPSPVEFRPNSPPPPATAPPPPQAPPTVGKQQTYRLSRCAILALTKGIDYLARQTCMLGATPKESGGDMNDLVYELLHGSARPCAQSTSALQLHGEEPDEAALTARFIKLLGDTLAHHKRPSASSPKSLFVMVIENLEASFCLVRLPSVEVIGSDLQTVLNRCSGKEHPPIVMWVAQTREVALYTKGTSTAA